MDNVHRGGQSILLLSEAKGNHYRRLESNPHLGATQPTPGLNMAVQPTRDVVFEGEWRARVNKK